MLQFLALVSWVVRSCALVDGRVVGLDRAVVSIGDPGASRGDGAFETVGVWSGRPFRLDDHLVRLAGSLAAIGLPMPDEVELRAEVARLLAAVDPVDGRLRLYVTAAGTRLLTFEPPPQRPPLRVLAVQPAPWIRPLGTYGPAGAKTLSYGPNEAATRAARRAGADDALLVALEGWVLEGPTFGLLWVTPAGALRGAATALGIVDSVSRRAVLELAVAAGLAVELGAYPLADLHAATEVLVSSSVRSLQAIHQVDDVALPPSTPVRDLLAPGLDALRRAQSVMPGS